MPCRLLLYSILSKFSTIFQIWRTFESTGFSSDRLIAVAIAKSAPRAVMIWEIYYMLRPFIDLLTFEWFNEYLKINLNGFNLFFFFILVYTEILKQSNRNFIYELYQARCSDEILISSFFLFISSFERIPLHISKKSTI